MRLNRIAPVVGLLGLGAVAAAAPPVFTGPTPYESIADSPYFGDGQTCYALETFPDGVQSQPAFQFNSQTGAEIVPGIGVPPGGHVLQANPLGVIQLSFTTPVFEVGFVWTGGDSIGSTITLTVISGTEAISQQYANLPPNAPNNPADNRFFGVAWDVGIQQLRITFLPFGPSIPNQIDDIQFNLAPQVVAIDPSSAAFDNAAGSGSFNVTMNGVACEWSASTASDWITLTTASGTGDGTVEFTVAENLGGDIRTGTILIGDSEFTVNQDSEACSVTEISPSATTIAAAGGADAFSVTVSLPICTWSATASDAWITLTTDSGTGNGSVPFSVAENPSADPRSGTIVVGGFGFTVNQDPAACAVTGLSATEADLPASSGSGSFGVTVNGTTCPWFATASADWITLVTDSGTGNGSVQFEVAENTSANPRTGTINVDGRTFTVDQQGAACQVTGISAPSTSIPDSGGTGSFDVSVNGDSCEWFATTSDTWINLTTASGMGNGTVEFSVDPNIEGLPRNGSIAVGPFTFSVNQSSLGPDLNRDGNWDFITSTPGNSISAWLLDSDGVPIQSTAVGTQAAGWSVVATDDFVAGNEGCEVIFQNATTGQLVYWSLGGQAGVQYQNWGLLRNGASPLMVGSGWTVVGSTDFDGDGKPDLLLRNLFNGKLVIWKMDGLNYVSYAFVHPGDTPLTWRVGGAYGFGDGTSIIVFQNMATGVVHAWYLNGFSYQSFDFYRRASNGSVVSAPPGWTVVGTYLFSGDPIPSLLLQSSTGAVVRWRNDANLRYVNYNFVSSTIPSTVRVQPH